MDVETVINTLENLLDNIPVEYDYAGVPMDKDLDSAMERAERIIQKYKQMNSA